MEKIIKCKVLDVREFRKKDNYYYHIILKDLTSNKRFVLKFNDLDESIYKDGKYYTIYNYETLINNDIIEIKINKEDRFIEFIILEEESEA